MVYILTLTHYKSRKKTKPIVFTDYTCKGKPVQHAEIVARRSQFNNMDSMQLCRRHFTGRYAKADFGYGVGNEPIICGMI